MSSEEVRIGVFIPNGCQFLDVATVDAFGTMSRDYLTPMAEWFPQVDTSKAPLVKILYITSPEQGNDIPLTSNATLKAHHSYTDPEVAPGKLDFIVFESPGVDVLSVCTGVLICAEAGIADGKQASGPQSMHEYLVNKFPKVNFVADKHRWVRDGNYWSSGGVTNGNDLIAAYALASGRFPKEVAQLGLSIVETSDRGQFYDASKN
ncbi:hypothetical protein PT974_09162 [Cladobotryum mycophilum]|uniref:DJ-1/PfpI domain-containing protein n=1 Tax=Cladobotryum mycophilum TaxID=491253 RepID=A0ABR0SGF0_9HYPO